MVQNLANRCSLLISHFSCISPTISCNTYTHFAACGAGLFKATVGNEQCETCTNGQVPNSDRTGCECAPGYTGPSCGGKSYTIS